MLAFSRSVEAEEDELLRIGMGDLFFLRERT